MSRDEKKNSRETPTEDSKDCRSTLHKRSNLTLNLNEGGIRTYCINDIIGRGGSCIVYSGTWDKSCKNTGAGQTKAGEVPCTHIIKEFFPDPDASGLDWLSRNGGEIGIINPNPKEFIESSPERKDAINKKEEEQKKLFEDLRKRFIITADEFEACYEKFSNFCMPRPIFCATANNNTYIISDFLKGELLTDWKAPTLYAVAEVMFSLCGAAACIHNDEDEYLFLDFKPLNIFVVENSCHFDVRLFDFDTIIKKSDLKDCQNKFSAFSEGWAPLEQKLWSADEIGEATDIYSIGAVFFWLLTGRKPTSEKQPGGFDSDLEEICNGTLALRDESFTLCKNASDECIGLINKIFLNTLQVAVSNRSQDIGDIIKNFKELKGITMGKAENESLYELIKNNQEKPCLEDGPIWKQSDKAIGRKKEIEMIHDIFKESNIAFIQGMGGLGKSELAKMYVAQYRQDYKIVKFITFTESLKVTISAIEVKNFDEQSDFRVMEKITGAGCANMIFSKKLSLLKEQDSSTLIVIDNFNKSNDSILTELWSKKCRFLFTTRYKQINFDDITVRLEELDPDTAYKLFGKHCKVKEADSDYIKELLKLIDYNTLVLVLMANAINRKVIVVEKLIDAINKYKLKSVTGKVPYYVVGTDETNERTIIGHLRVVFKLSALSKGEKYIMTNLALVPQEGIMQTDFTEWTNSGTDEMFNLIDSGWLQQDKNNEQVYVHPVVSNLAYEDLKPDTIKCKQYISAINVRINGKLDKFQADYLCGIAYAVVQKLDDKSKDYALFCSNAGYACVTRLRYKDALICYKKALEIQEKVLEKEHPATATTYENIAWVYRELGNYHDARERYKKALKILEKVYGKDRPETASTCNNIAKVCGDLGYYQEALKWYEKVLKIQEKESRKQHSETGTTYNYMAWVYRKSGNYQDALDRYIKALDLQEKVLRKELPYTASTCNNFAIAVKDSGNYQKALEYANKAFAIRVKELGKTHPDTGSTCNNIAMAHMDLGDYKKAMDWSKKALKICEKALGEEHPTTGTIYNDRARIYGDTGEKSKALEWYNKALKIREKVLGIDHPATGATYYYMAGVCRDLGQYKDALTWYKKSLEIREKVLGKVHPDTGATYYYMAGVYKDLGKQKEALKRYKKALDIQKALEIREKF